MPVLSGERRQARELLRMARFVLRMKNWACKVELVGLKFCSAF